VTARRPYARTLARVLSGIGVVVFVLSVKVISSAHAELEEAERWRAEGSVESAVTHYRRAARWYLPVNPYSDAALDELATIATEAEASNDTTLALSTWRSVRAAIESSRSFYLPNRDRLDVADEHIAALMARVEVPPVDAARTEEERREIHLELLREDRDPSVLWAVVALLGLVGWVGAALAFSMRGIDEEDRLVSKEARRWGTAFVVGFGLFVLGLLLA
jgi:hypothetical protein